MSEPDADGWEPPEDEPAPAPPQEEAPPAPAQAPVAAPEGNGFHARPASERRIPRPTASPTEPEAPLQPQHIEAELAILGELLMFPDEAGPVALPVLKPEDFYVDAHGRAARILFAGIEDGRPHDALTFARALRADHDYHGREPGDFVIAISDAAPIRGDYAAHVAIVKECAIKRGIIRAAQVFMDEGRNGKPAIEALADQRVRVEDLEREGAGSALKTFSAADLPTMEIQPLIPVVGDNLLSEAGFLAVVGKQGLGKTFAVFDLALRLSTGGGGKWLGHELAHEAMPVLWLFGEGGRPRVKQRAMDLAGEHPLPERLAFYVPEDYALDLCKASDVARVRMTVEAMKDRWKARTVLLVIDPLADWAVYDQNTEADRLIRGLRSFQRKLNATVLVVHHPKKPQMGGRVGDSNNARGDSRLAGAVQSMLMLDEEEEGKVRFTWAKHNDSPHQEPFIAALNGETRRFDVLHKLGDRPSSGTLIFQALEEARVTSDGWVFKKALAVAAGVAPRTVERHLQGLIKAGRVECDGDQGGTAARYRFRDSME